MKQLKRRIERLENEQSNDNYSGLDLLLFSRSRPSSPKRQLLDVRMSDWFEGLSGDD